MIGRTGGKKTVLGEGALSNSPTTMMLGKEHLSGICADCERLQLFFATNMHFFLPHSFFYLKHAFFHLMCFFRIVAGFFTSSVFQVTRKMCRS